MEKKTLLAIVLSAAVWIGWFAFFQPEQGKKMIQPTQKSAEIAKKDARPANNQKRIISSVKIKKFKAPQKESSIKFETEKFDITFSNMGASIKKVKLKDKDIELTIPDAPYRAKGIMDFPVHFSDKDFLYGNTLDKSTWMWKKNTNSSITFYTRVTINGTPVQVEKTFSFKKDTYDFNVDYAIKNIGRKTLNIENGNIIFSTGDMLGPKLDYSNTYNKLSSIYSLNGDFEQAHKGGGFFSKNDQVLKKETGNINWTGMMSRYCLIIMIPQDFTGSGVVYDNRNDAGYRTGMYVSVNNIQPGQSIKKAFKIYLGYKDKTTLVSVDPTIKDAADVSRWIEPIRWFVMWCLLGLDKLFGNLGWALVIFSILTKIVFMPLTLKSTKSMQKMQTLTPKINEIKKKYKDKPDVMQKQIMALYKDNKVNPMGGCLPLLLQMPFFFALYSALINSVDLWHAPFILWMQDLSMPDTVATISGFNINILPIVMTLSTFVQQKLSTVDTGQGQQQKMMMMMMPAVFIFIFWTMPSGLVLYWTLQNSFQIIHQLVTNKLGKNKKE